MAFSNDTLATIQSKVRELKIQAEGVQGQLDDVTNHLNPLQQQQITLQNLLNNLNDSIANLQQDADLLVNINDTTQAADAGVMEIIKTGMNGMTTPAKPTTIESVKPV